MSNNERFVNSDWPTDEVWYEVDYSDNERHDDFDLTQFRGGFSCVPAAEPRSASEFRVRSSVSLSEPRESRDTSAGVHVALSCSGEFYFEEAQAERIFRTFIGIVLSD